MPSNNTHYRSSWAVFLERAQGIRWIISPSLRYHTAIGNNSWSPPGTPKDERWSYFEPPAVAVLSIFHSLCKKKWEKNLINSHGFFQSVWSLSAKPPISGILTGLEQGKVMSGKPNGLYFSLTRQLRSDLSHLHLKLFINLKSRIWQFISRHCSCPAPTSCLWTLTRRQHPRHYPQCATKVWLSHGHLWSIWTTAFCSRHCQPQKSKVQAPVTETL